MNRRSLLTVVILAGLAATVGLNQWVGSEVPQSAGSSPSGTQSSALYCAGLTNAAGGAFGEVVFINTSDTARTLTATVAAVGRAGSSASTSRVIAPYAQSVLVPSRVLAGSAYAVSATVSGGGVYAQEVLGKDHAEAPCQSGGVTQWFASGLSTSVGSSAHLTLFNPTATNAVFNVKTYATNGFAQPARFQGLSVAPHGVIQVDLGRQIVNIAHFGVEVDVLRGSLVIAGNQVVGSVGSITMGSPIATRALFPLVPTDRRSVATVVFSNPGALPVHVTLAVALGTFTIPTQTVEVAPFSTNTFAVTPNTVIPAAGEARVSLSANEPIVSALLTGSTSGLVVSPAPAVSSAWTLSDTTGRGFGDVRVTNSSDRSISVQVSVNAIGRAPTTHALTLGPAQTASVVTLSNSHNGLAHSTVQLRTASSVLVLAATGVSAPRGVTPQSVLQGG